MYFQTLKPLPLVCVLTLLHLLCKCSTAVQTSARHVKEAPTTLLRWHPPITFSCLSCLVRIITLLLNGYRDFTWNRPVTCNLSWQKCIIHDKRRTLKQKNHYIVVNGSPVMGKQCNDLHCIENHNKQKQACITQRATSPLSPPHPAHCLPITSNVHPSAAWPQPGSPSALARQSTRSSGPPYLEPV